MNLQSLVIARHSHLKWRALDPLEAVLMALCGISIGGFTLSVFCDVVTREIGAPWLWLQLVTTGWTQPATTVTVSFTEGWALGVDDITYSTAP